jgi:NDP-sugar pyrophosphorylase family protein
MKKSNFLPNDFFNLLNFPFADIFENESKTWEVLSKIQEYIKLQFKNKKIKQNYDKNKEIFIGKRTTIAKGVLIKGPAIIGDDCYIEHGSLIRENVILGNNVHVGHGVEIKNSIILNNTAISHLNYVGDSIVGNNVNISGGAIIANYRFDKHSVLIRLGDKKTDTKLYKFGAIVGDGSIIGVNSVLNPGTVLGKNTIVYPLVSVIGVHKNEEIIK